MAEVTYGAMTTSNSSFYKAHSNLLNAFRGFRFDCFGICVYFSQFYCVKREFVKLSNQLIHCFDF